MKAGDRVGAILGSDPSTKTCEFLGYGVYAGDFVPETAVGFFAEIDREIGHTNPRIDLDNGKVVWGCECWWGSEEKVKATIEGMRAAGWTVVECDIEQVRKDHAEEKG